MANLKSDAKVDAAAELVKLAADAVRNFEASVRCWEENASETISTLGTFELEAGNLDSVLSKAELAVVKDFEYKPYQGSREVEVVSVEVRTSDGAQRQIYFQGTDQAAVFKPGRRYRALLFIFPLGTPTPEE